MADTNQPFQYTGGAGAGPAGAMPAGAAFEADNVVAARPDIRAPVLEYENKALKLPSDGQ